MPSFTSIDLIFGCGMEAGRIEAVAASSAFVADTDCICSDAESVNSCAALKPFTPESTPPGMPSALRVSSRCSENVPEPAYRSASTLFTSTTTSRQWPSFASGAMHNTRFSSWLPTASPVTVMPWNTALVWVHTSA